LSVNLDHLQPSAATLAQQPHTLKPAQLEYHQGNGCRPMQGATAVGSRRIY
jgi:hypothetical protein